MEEEREAEGVLGGSSSASRLPTAMASSDTPKEQPSSTGSAKKAATGSNKKPKPKKPSIEECMEEVSV